MDKRVATVTEAPPCPRCGPGAGAPQTHIRKGAMDLADMHPGMGFDRGTVSGVYDVGWQCVNCEHEWGFEFLTDEYLDVVHQLTGGTSPADLERAARIIGQWHGQAPDGAAEGR